MEDEWDEPLRETDACARAMLDDEEALPTQEPLTDDWRTKRRSFASLV